jgi:CRP-like cAMP-binding protein
LDGFTAGSESVMFSLDENKLEKRSLARNELLFRQGDRVQAIYFVEEGRLRLDRRTFDGRSLVFGTTSAGEFFVEAALFAEIFHCDGVATEPSRVGIYPKAAVLNALNTNPSSVVPFLKRLAHQVIEGRQRLELMKVRSAKERVLLYLDLHAGADGSLTLKGELQDVAGELGLTREAFYRTLPDLERAGAIERSGASVVLRRSPGA